MIVKQTKQQIYDELGYLKSVHETRTVQRDPETHPLEIQRQKGKLNFYNLYEEISETPTVQQKQAIIKGGRLSILKKSVALSLFIMLCIYAITLIPTDKLLTHQTQAALKTPDLSKSIAIELYESLIQEAKSNNGLVDFQKFKSKIYSQHTEQEWHMFMEVIYKDTKTELKNINDRKVFSVII